MDTLSSVGGAGGAKDAAASADLIMLKKTQDLAKEQCAQLLEALPKSPSPPGVGGNIDISA